MNQRKACCTLGCLPCPGCRPRGSRSLFPMLPPGPCICIRVCRLSRCPCSGALRGRPSPTATSTPPRLGDPGAGPQQSGFTFFMCRARGLALEGRSELSGCPRPHLAQLLRTKRPPSPAVPASPVSGRTRPPQNPEPPGGCFIQTLPHFPEKPTS